jgi:DNA polymerase III subunit chi
MKAIEFHFNVPDKLSYSCRLIRKAYRSGASSVVTGEPEFLKELDRLLWALAPTDFLPHCIVGDNAHVVAATPVLLAENAHACPSASVLINVGQQTPDDFARFERFIEVVSNGEEDRALGRSRWKQYRQDGHALTQHDASAREPV